MYFCYYYFLFNKYHYYNSKLCISKIFTVEDSPFYRFIRLIEHSFDKQKQIAEKNEELIYCE